METEYPNERVMAFIISVRERGLVRETEGYAMFATPGIAKELDYGRRIDDLMSLDSDLDLSRPYPAFMVWEGSVQYSVDDVFATGQWRRAKGSEILAAAAGRNPFAPAVVHDAPLLG